MFFKASCKLEIYKKKNEKYLKNPLTKVESCAIIVKS